MKITMIKNNFSQRGQVMLLVTLALSMTVFTMTVLAGVFTVYQIRQTYNAVNSSKAFYAADTGAELELYRWYRLPPANRQACFPRGGGARNCFPMYWDTVNGIYVPTLNSQATILTLPQRGSPAILLVNGRIGGRQLGSTRNLVLRSDPNDPLRIIRGER